MRVWKASWFAAVVATAVGFVGVAVAKQPPREKVTPALSEDIANVPGKKLVGMIVDYPPGGTTPSHRHAKSAFITGYVLRERSEAGSTRRRRRSTRRASVGRKLR